MKNCIQIHRVLIERKIEVAYLGYFVVAIKRFYFIYIYINFHQSFTTPTFIHRSELSFYTSLVHFQFIITTFFIITNLNNIKLQLHTYIYTYKIRENKNEFQ